MQVIGLVAVQCVLPFQHKFKCKNSNAALQRTIWSKVSLCALSRHLSSLLDISKKECNCRRLSLEWKYGALKRDEESLAVSHTHTHTNTHTHAHTRMHTHTHTAYSLCASTSSSSSAVKAAEEGARRPLGPSELARVGCVRALCDERVQISDAYLLLCLGLWEEKTKLKMFLVKI